jgi:hypothetical protein
MEEIPKINIKDSGPGWIPLVDRDGHQLKPLIKCKCGQITNIGLHHVHADGTVTRSYYHSKDPTFTEGGKAYSHITGCGWHVWLKLKDYDQGDFPPTP